MGYYAAALRIGMKMHEARWLPAADASTRSSRISNPACSLRDSSTRRIFTDLRYRFLDLLQTKLFDLVDQIAIFRQCLRPFHFERFVLCERPLGAADVAIQGRRARIHSKAHAKQHVLIARG